MVLEMNQKLNHRIRTAQNAIWLIEDIISQEEAIKMTGKLQKFKDIDD